MSAVALRALSPLEASAKERATGKIDTLCARVEDIRTLRRAILGMAIRGVLTSRSNGDEPAALLLERLHEERVVARGERTKTTGPDAAPFELPNTWAWARLDQLWRSITDGDHQPPPKSERGMAFLTIGNVSKGSIDFTSTRFVPKEYFSGLDELRVPQRGDLLYTVVGSYGIPVLVDVAQSFCVQRHIAILKPLPSTNVPFMRLLMGSDFVYQQARNGATGIAQPTVGLAVLRNFVVPVPPLAEQERIVAKVNKLMRMLDQLEVKLTKKRETQALLRSAALGALTSAEGPEEFDAAWNRVSENFDLLFWEAAGLGELRKAILDLATVGRLTARLSRSASKQDRVSRDPLDGRSPEDQCGPITEAWSWPSPQMARRSARRARRPPQ